MRSDRALDSDPPTGETVPITCCPEVEPTPSNHRKPPIGIRTFAQIVGEGYYYVDKTPFAHRLIESGKCQELRTGPTATSSPEIRMI